MNFDETIKKLNLQLPEARENKIFWYRLLV